MTPRTKAVLILLGAVAFVWLLVGSVYPALPETVPAHLNAAGQVDRWGVQAGGARPAPDLHLRGSRDPADPACRPHRVE